MASSWGSSWGVSWGDSWGATVPVVPVVPVVPPPDISGGTTSPRPRRPSTGKPAPRPPTYIVAEIETGQGGQSVSAAGSVLSGTKQNGGHVSAECQITVPCVSKSSGSQSAKVYGRASLVGRVVTRQAGVRVDVLSTVMVRMVVNSGILVEDVPAYDGDSLFADGYHREAA